MGEADVKVKKLIWTDPVGDNETCSAPAPFGHYLIAKENGWWSVYNAKDATFICSKPTIGYAKEAAQRDFSERIVSCLE